MGPGIRHRQLQRLQKGSDMRKTLFLVYGGICYLIFFGTFLYAIGFIGNLVVPRTIDSNRSGGSIDTSFAVLVNLILLGLFAVQHSVMARPGFKKHWTKLVPLPIERASYVLASSLVLILLFWQWRPMPGVIWEVDALVAQRLLWGLYFAGILLVLYATFLIDHFDLFGLRQVVLYLRGREYENPQFKTPSLYRVIRHPLYLGWLITFWATPRMTAGHLLFAIVTTAYIFFAIVLEERDLEMFIGDDYRRYRKQTPMIIPFVRIP